MVIAASEAFDKTIGLIITFGGIGVVVNIILVYIAIQVRGERRREPGIHGIPPASQLLTVAFRGSARV